MAFRKKIGFARPTHHGYGGGKGADVLAEEAGQSVRHIFQIVMRHIAEIKMAIRIVPISHIPAPHRAQSTEVPRNDAKVFATAQA